MGLLRVRGYDLLALLILISTSLESAISDPILLKVDRLIDLTSPIVRSTTTIKVENSDSSSLSEVLLAFPDLQAKNLAYLSAAVIVGKGKTKTTGANLPLEVVNPHGMPSALTFYSLSLPNPLGKGDTLTFKVHGVFTHALRPFPEKISQADIQLVLFQESAHFISPYPVISQSLTVKLPAARIESYTKLDNTKIHGSEIKYGPFNNLPPFSFASIVFHFEINEPFAVAQELTREIEISHWGNVQITEHYNIVHNGAKSRGEFSRLDYQARPTLRGAYAFHHLLANLPPRTRSIYYRDEIGNISTSHVFGDSKKTHLVVEPRYPMFGGWRSTFTIGYGLPLEDFLFKSKEKRFLNISFGSPMTEIVIDKLVVKVVLPEGSHDTSVSTPFPVKLGEETKLSHLDISGRPVILLEKLNVVPEHNQHFQVYYDFNNISLLREPVMLISGIFFFFVACIVYMHFDFTISKSSASYIAKLQWEEVRGIVQEIHSRVNQCLTVHDKLEASLRDLSRTGDVQACKAARKTADGLLKDHSKELKRLLTSLQSLPPASVILPKLDDLVAKEKELQDKLIAKHATLVECYERKMGAREIETRAAPQQQKILAARQELEDLLDYIDEI